jgi:hypothetical protein
LKLEKDDRKSETLSLSINVTVESVYSLALDTESVLKSFTEESVDACIFYYWGFGLTGGETHET